MIPAASVSEPTAFGVTSTLSMPGFGGDNPVLIGICLCLGLVAMAAVINAFSSRKQASASARLAKLRARKMSEMLRTVRMAERIAGLGVWQFDPATGQQQWSRGMQEIFGLDEDGPMVVSDAETVLLANVIDLVAEMRVRNAETEPFDLTFKIVDSQAKSRSISVQACNLRNADGSVARVIAIIRDVTDQITQERDLRHSRERALCEAREAREQAATDALTGLANRRHVMAKLDQYITGAKNDGSKLALIMFDLDHFKSINDTYGHPGGDAILRQVAELARSKARESDLVGRVGGEEFVWIAPGIGVDSAYMLADRLRKAIAEHSGTQGVSGVTASIGCAELRPGDSPLSIFARADGALYAAKHAGRNQVRLAA